MSKLQSYLSGQWVTGDGEGSPLVNPMTDEVLATASSEGLDLGGALSHARSIGGPALRAMTFAERGAALKALSAAIHEHREELIELGIRNAGNTRGDAKFDIDGATGTLASYAYFAKGLPADGTFLPDGDPIQLSRSPHFQGQHVWVSRLGVGVHINAFNFPAWGMMEKAACSLLAGVPVLEKPGTPTALMAERIAHIIVDSGILPEGAFSFLAGGAGDLLNHVESQDCVAFTGSSGTARILRAHPAFVQRAARLNAEADSLNAAVLGPDVEDDCAAFDMFLREMAREMTQKAGQKCTAVRRILVPEAMLDDVGEALVEALARVKVGAPTDSETRMGPLTNAAQLASVRQGLSKLQSVADVLCGGDSSPFEQGPFQMPTLLRARNGDADAVHADEVFGPVATLVPYSGKAEEAVRLVARGGGSLLTSLYSDNRRFATDLALGLAPWSGRIYMGGSKVAEHGMGPGLVLPSMTHGGPGRAGGGEELGGLRGLQFSMQRTALQGFKSLIQGSFGAPAPEA